MSKTEYSIIKRLKILIKIRLNWERKKLKIITVFFLINFFNFSICDATPPKMHLKTKKKKKKGKQGVMYVALARTTPILSIEYSLKIYYIKRGILYWIL